MCAMCGVCSSSMSFKSLHIIPGPQSFYGRVLLLCPMHVTCMCACYMYVCMLHVCVHVTCMCACYMYVCMLCDLEYYVCDVCCTCVHNRRQSLEGQRL